MENLKETIKFHEEESSSAKLQLDHVTQECDNQVEEVSGLKETISKLEQDIQSNKSDYEKLLENVSFVSKKKTKKTTYNNNLY